MAETKEKIMGKPVETDEAANDAIRLSQTNSESRDHADLVEVTIIKDGDFYKKGDIDYVHPSLACILKEKGLIADTGKPYTRRKFDQKDVIVDV